MRLKVTIFAIAFLSGCATGPAYDNWVKERYRQGMSRDEAHEVLAYAQLLASVSRPRAGWSAIDGSYQASRAASYFETEHPHARVESCEVYLIWRQGLASIPMPAGFWYDYLFFNTRDTLLGYRWRFID